MKQITINVPDEGEMTLDDAIIFCKNKVDFYDSIIGYDWDSYDTELIKKKKREYSCILLYLSMYKEGLLEDGKEVIRS